MIPPSLMAWNPNKLMKCLFVKLFLGTGHATKLDGFSERFQTAVDPHPHPSEWSLSLEIICMPFILSAQHTSSHIWKHIYRKKLQHIFPKIRGRGAKAVWIFFPKIHPICVCRLNICSYFGWIDKYCKNTLIVNLTNISSNIETAVLSFQFLLFQPFTSWYHSSVQGQLSLPLGWSFGFCCSISSASWSW